MTTSLTPRPLVVAIDAAIAHQQHSIEQLVRLRALAMQHADDADIDAAYDDWCPTCGPACACGVKALVAEQPPSMLDDPIFFPDRKMAESIERQIGGVVPR